MRATNRRLLIAGLLVAVAAIAVPVSLFAVNTLNDDDAVVSDYDPELYPSPQLEALIGVENYRTKFVHDHPPITCTDLPFCTEAYYHRFDSQLEKFIDEEQALGMRESLEVPTPTAVANPCKTSYWLDPCARRDNGPTTLGSFVQIDGQEIKLPDDAWVVEKIESTTCAPRYGVCGRDPLWILARADQEVTIDSDGLLWDRDLTGIDSPEFAFLRIAVDVKLVPGLNG